MIPIVILAGQSNMLGHGELSDIDDPLLPPDVKLFDLNPRDGCFGPEVGFARRHFLTYEPARRTCGLIKYAVGGSVRCSPGSRNGRRSALQSRTTLTKARFTRV